MDRLSGSWYERQPTWMKVAFWAVLALWFGPPMILMMLPR